MRLLCLFTSFQIFAATEYIDHLTHRWEHRLFSDRLKSASFSNAYVLRFVLYGAQMKTWYQNSNEHHQCMQ